MKNPKWQRDEIILALDLYFDPDRGSIEARNPNIIKLSETLNKLPVFPEKVDSEKFRNPNGVGLKLSNFLALDPGYHGKGMVAYSKLDKEVFEEFYNDRVRLKNIADQIRIIISDETLRKNLYHIEDDENFEVEGVSEGQVLYKFHKFRERNNKIISAKKKTVLKATGNLSCEVCQFDFYKTYGELGFGFIECHHIRPISDYFDNMETKMSDLALVCANCHRMLHRNLGSVTIGQLRDRIKNI